MTEKALGGKHAAKMLSKTAGQHSHWVYSLNKNCSKKLINTVFQGKKIRKVVVLEALRFNVFLPDFCYYSITLTYKIFMHYQQHVNTGGY